MLQTVILGLIGISLAVFGIAYQSYIFVKNKGYTELHFRWPLLVYGLMTSAGLVTIIITQVMASKACSDISKFFLPWLPFISD